MNQTVAVQPDLEFKRTVLGLDAGDLSACYQCGTCSVVCPISTDDDPFPRKEMVWTQWGLKERLMHDPAIWLCHQCQLGMGTTKAIYLPHAMAFPMKYVIDDTACKPEACAKCVDACRYGAIDLAMQARSIRLKAGAVIMATGWDPYDAARIDNLGFGRHADIVTNVMMERLAAPNGPTRGRLVRPSDGREVKRIAFVQCAGSRDALHLGYCSAICCLASLKQASYVIERHPDAEVTIFYIDLRTPGGYDAFSRKVQASGNVNLIKGKVAKIVEDAGDLVVEAEDTLALAKRRVAVDMVVLASGMAAALDDGKPQGDIAFDNDHFVVADETALGIYAAGCARGPVDVATAVQEATAVAMKAIGAIQTAARG